MFHYHNNQKDGCKQPTSTEVCDPEKAQPVAATKARTTAAKRTQHALR
jgi:hypothetical protein